MDIKFNSENNSMNSLSFYWIAEFKDGTKINQFDNNGIEHRFQEIIKKDKFNNLSKFILLKKDLSYYFSVNLIEGFITLNDYKTVDPNLIEKKDNIRLIYFRRHTVKIGTQDLKEKEHTIEYHLGFQYNDKLGNNRQIVLIIDSKGNWVLGE
jgi:hypothetical protein